MKCNVCGRENIGTVCPKCFMDNFQAGFNEADEEIRNANPHIYGRTTWGETAYGQRQFWEDINRSGFAPKRKPPWPKPTISWIPDFESRRGDWKVFDPVTEGWVLVPLEAVEARLGRPIENHLLGRYNPTQEILECARRLLILLIYGCPPKLSAPVPEPKDKTDWKAFRDQIFDMKFKYQPYYNIKIV